MSGGHSRKKLDLTGRRYGHLTILGPAENVGTRTAWRCRCDCGQETVVKTHHLRYGHTKTCGCQNGAGVPRFALGLTYIDGTCVEMLAAKTVRRNNTSGVTGVDWRPAKRLWRASICFKGKRYYLGSYALFEDAVKARKRAEEELLDPFLREFAQAPRVDRSGMSPDPVPHAGAVGIDVQTKSDINQQRKDACEAAVLPLYVPAVAGANARARLANPEKSGDAKPRN